MTYAEAMTRYGSDKPDVRFGNELVDVTELLRRDDLPGVPGAARRCCRRCPVVAARRRKELDGWQDWAKARGARGLAYVLVGEDGELGGPVAKNLSDTERAGLADAVGAAPGDAIFFAAGERRASLELLGAARLEIGRRCGLIDESAWAFLWVVDAPLFEPDGEGGWTSVHHPFTAPNGEWQDAFDLAPGDALGYAYDMVLNGNEIGGGSIRIHRTDVQQRVFDVLGLSREEAEGKFGFLLEALRYGPPPHGGIAFGLDRLVALLAGAGVDPRGHRLPEDRVRRRPAHRCADADHATRSVPRRASTRCSTRTRSPRRRTSRAAKSSPTERR